MGEFYCLFSIHLHKCMDLLIPTTTVQIVKTFRNKNIQNIHAKDKQVFQEQNIQK